MDTGYSIQYIGTAMNVEQQIYIDKLEVVEFWLVLSWVRYDDNKNDENNYSNQGEDHLLSPCLVLK